MCQNFTMDNTTRCFGPNETVINETLEADQHDVEKTNNVDLHLQVKYYCEGVILVPLAIFGLFGNY